MSSRCRVLPLILALVLLLGGCGSPAGEDSSAMETPPWEEACTRGKSLLSEGKVQEAIDAFTESIQLEPGHLEPYLYRGSAWARLARRASGDASSLTQEARDMWTSCLLDSLEALKLDNRNRMACQNAGEAYAATGDMAGAREVLTVGYNLTGDSSLQEFLARLEEQYGTSEPVLVLSRQTVRDPEGTLLAEFSYVYSPEGQPLQRREWRLQPDGTFQETDTGFQGYASWVPEACTDPLTDEAQRAGVRESGGAYTRPPELQDQTAWDHAGYVFDGNGSPTEITSFDSAGAVTGTCILEWTAAGEGNS